MLEGGSGHDRYFVNDSNSRDNTLTGGLGHDTLLGGGGADTFVFGPAILTSRDISRDFVSGSDHLQFNSSDYSLLEGIAPDARLQNATAARLGHARFCFNAQNHTQYFDADGQRGAAVAVATLVGLESLSATDILLV